jgi:hypothetical protein
MDYLSHTLNVQNHVEDIEKITIETLKKKLIKCLDMGLQLVKVELDHDNWIQSAYLRSGNDLVILRSDESLPNKVNEVALSKSDIDWISSIL